MSLVINTTKITKIYKGSSLISKVYKGNQLVYQKQSSGLRLYGYKYESKDSYTQTYSIGGQTTENPIMMITTNAIEWNAVGKVVSEINGTLGETGSSIKISAGNNNEYKYNTQTVINGITIYLYSYLNKGSWITFDDRIYILPNSKVGSIGLGVDLASPVSETTPSGFKYPISIDNSQLSTEGGYSHSREPSLDVLWTVNAITPVT